MKKKSFGLILLMSVLVIVLLLYFFAMSIAKKEIENEDEENYDEQIVYIDRQASEVNSVKYTSSSDGASFTIKKSGSIYVLEQDESFPLDDSVVKFMTNAVAKISFTRRINPEGNDLQEYGLTEPHTVIEAQYKDGGKVVLKLGNYNKYAEAYYCTVGDGFIYLLSSQFGEAFSYSFSDLILDDTISLPQYGFSSITHIEVSSGEGTVIYALKDDNSWSKSGFDGDVLEGDFTEQAQKIYSQLFLIETDEWVDYTAESEDVRNKYGLNSEIRVLFRHILSVDVEVDDGSSVVTKDYEEETVFLIGNALSDNDDGEEYRYFMFGDGQIVYVVSHEQIDSVM